MGKASSAKKVARAARAGSSAKRERPKVGFPIAVFAIVVLGTSLVVFARTSREPASASPPSYLNNDHWHAAYGAYVCDAFLPPWSDAIEDRDGIHTHQDGIIHIHPFSSSASGDRARLSVFAKQVGVTFTDDGFTTPDGTEYTNGHDCNGQPAKVAVYKWFPDDPTRPGEVYESNFNNIVFDTDRAAYTIAVVPDGVTPPLPESVPTLDNLTDVAGGGATGAPGTQGFDPSQLSIDPNTGQPIIPTDPSAGVDPATGQPIIPTDPSAAVDPATGQPIVPADPSASTPVTDAGATGGESTPSASESTPASSTP
jgi:hypothetical protein